MSTPLHPWEENLQKRNPKMWQQQLAPLNQHQNILLTSPCDLGVMRNGGKRGAKHGPQAITAILKKMVAPHDPKEIGFYQHFSQNQDINEFSQIQEEQRNSLCQNLHHSMKKIAHIGGGHDHAYPLIAGYLDSRPQEKVHIINIDAHLDTRSDQEVHSGTPFRQLNDAFKNRISITQVGIHHFSNGPKNFEKMNDMDVIIWKPDWNLIKLIESALEKHSDKTLILSVDCDGLDASYMNAVSAPNHRGLTQQEFWELFSLCQNFWQATKSPAIYGIYEFNPLFDNISTQAARFTASTLYDFFNHD